MTCPFHLCTAVADQPAVWLRHSPRHRELQSMTLLEVLLILLVRVQAQKYAALKKPYLINDMVMQDVLLDRRKVYGKLKVCTADWLKPCV